MAEWKSIPLISMEMNLDLTLSSGQAFRWVRGEGGEWSGAIGDRLFILRHHGNTLHYRVATPSSDPVEDRRTLEHYFRLDSDLTSLYSQWSHDQNFREKASRCKGIRLLRQPTLETLVAFICSSNNNIPRISGMVTSFCAAYGALLGIHEGCKYYSFPSITSLVGVVSETALRDMGFGYRAKYVKRSMEEVGKKGGEEWVSSLRQQSYKEAWLQLQQLPGVGAKVADCVCLMGLDHLEAVPVDVHVRRLAQRDYGVGGASPSLTPAAYRTVGNRFRDVFGETAGWAQAVLFTAELQHQKQFPSQRPQRGGGPQSRGLRGGGPQSRGLRGGGPQSRGLRGGGPQSRGLRGGGPQSRGLRGGGPQKSLRARERK